MELKNNYQYLLLSQYRMAVYDDTEMSLTHDNLIKAITLNENLLSLGYTLTAKDIITIASSPSLDTFYLSIKSIIPDIKAKPMYPNFPKQVMEMDEATYRFHQMCHYFSTYGIESMLPVEVLKGWLPEVEDAKKVEEDDTLLKAKVLRLLPCKSQYKTPYTIIVSKTERMTEVEKEIVKQASTHIPLKTLQETPIPFKENLLELSWILFNTLDKKTFQDTLSKICKHTGDVLKVIEYIYKRNHYHFKTSQKRMFAQVIERFSPEDLEINMMLSWKKREDVINILQGLDYQCYSRSLPHLHAVKKLRNKELQSWNGKVDALLKAKDKNAVSFIGNRPGMLLRMVAWLLRLGYSKDDIKKELLSHADELSMPTLVTVLTYFGGQEEVENGQDVYDILYDVLAKRLQSIKTPLQNLKVYVDEGEISMKDSIIECNDKSGEGGYLRSGLAIKIPEDVDRMRFFVYWNDKHRVDVDLHANVIDNDGNDIHVGWNGYYNKSGIVMSGDITHSDAAEFIDIDLKANILNVETYVNLFDGKRNFKEIDEFFVGMMAVKKLGEDVKLYNPKNCFFIHHLRQPLRNLIYGKIDVERRLLVFNGKDKVSRLEQSRFNLEAYVDMLCMSQGCERVQNKENANVILTVEKTEGDKNVSLLDNNFFIE